MQRRREQGEETESKHKDNAFLRNSAPVKIKQTHDRFVPWRRSSLVAASVFFPAIHGKRGGSQDRRVCDGRIGLNLE